MTPEEKKEYNKRWREKNPEYNKRWREEHLEHKTEYNKQWREENPEHNKQWRKNNPDKAKAYRAKQTKSGKNAYKSIKNRCNNPNNKMYKYYGGRGIKCIFTREEFLSIYFRTDNCKMCGCKLTRGQDKTSRTIDRINSDGHYEVSNCQIICRGCNTRKSNRGKQKIIFFDALGRIVYTDTTIKLEG